MCLCLHFPQPDTLHWYKSYKTVQLFIIKFYNKGKQWLLVCHILVCIYIKLKSKTREKRKTKLSLQACILFRNWDGKFNIYVRLSHFHDYILGKSMNSLKAILISIGNIVIYHVLWLCSHGIVKPMTMFLPLCLKCSHWPGVLFRFRQFCLCSSFLACWKFFSLFFRKCVR